MTIEQLQSRLAEVIAENEALKNQVHVLQSEILWLRKDSEAKPLNNPKEAAWWEKQE